MRIIKQIDQNDCGPAAVATMLGMLSKNRISDWQIKQIICPTRYGTNFISIISGLKSVRIKSTVQQCVKDIAVFDEIEFPVLTQIMQHGYLHFVVITKCTRSKVYWADPGIGKIESNYKSNFLTFWNPIILTIPKSQSYEFLKAKIKALKRPTLWLSFKKHWLALLIYWILSIIVFAITLFLATMYAAYFNRIVPNKFISAIPTMTSVYLTIQAAALLLEVINAILIAFTGNAISNELYKDIFTAFPHKKRSVIESFKDGEIITRFNAIYQIAGRQLVLLGDLPIDIITMSITLFLLGRINPFLTILLLIPMILMSLLFYLSSDTIKKRSTNLFKSQEIFSQDIIEQITNFSTIKTFHAGTYITSKITKSMEKYIIANRNFSLYDRLQQIARNGVSQFFSIILFSVGAFLVIKGNIVLGTLLSFYALTGNVLNPFIKIITMQVNLSQGKVATERYLDLLISSEDNTNMINQLTADSIELNKVTFSYDSITPIINNLTGVFSKFPTAIIGNSGGGKSTIAKLIAGFYPVDGLSIGGISYTKLGAKTISSTITYVEQSPQIFSDTIMNNITLGRKNITEKSVYEIANKIGFSTFLKQLPDGLNTRLGSSGYTLSGGQKQLLNIIRSMIVPSKFIIFDEITNGLDINTKNKVENYLLSQNEVHCIFITHDLTLAMKCIDIFTVKNGKILNVTRTKHTVKSLERTLL
uniref:AsmB n=1 Tax=Lactiplantibacillus plantarum TaxID=1590 RepID=A0A1B3IR16_LACPN|nr:ABC transporter transmembrane domain-containing protein [Lactiplantibacillus plantarum]AOF43521.1 AsmB [Lactiplantibacillus plantarum]